MGTASKLNPAIRQRRAERRELVRIMERRQDTRTVPGMAACLSMLAVESVRKNPKMGRAEKAFRTAQILEEYQANAQPKVEPDIPSATDILS